MTIGPQGVNPTGVRDGDPAALLALTAAHGGAVLAYCRAVCGDAAAPQAAAESFARFRAAFCAAQDASALDPEAMLLGATRHAAASMTLAPEELPGPGSLLSRARRRGAAESCAMVPTMLAARAANALSAEDEERLAQHLERCLNCSTVEARFAEAERIYADPPDIALPAGFADGMVAAMAAAVPPEAVLEAPREVADPQTEVFVPMPAVEETVDEEPVEEPVAQEPVHEPVEQEPVVAEAAEAEPFAAEPIEREPVDTRPVDEEPVEEEPVYEELLAAQRAHEDQAPVEDEVLEEEPEAESSQPIDDVPPFTETDDHPAVISIRGRPDGDPPPRRARAERRRPAALADLVLPAAIILAGVLVAMFIAGVFGGDTAQPAQSHEVPVRLAAPRPPVTTPLPVTAGSTAPSPGAPTTTTPTPTAPIITTTVTP